MKDNSIDMNFQKMKDSLSPIIEGLLGRVIEHSEDIKALVDDTSSLTEASEEDRKLAKDYLNEAITDIRSCRLLYKEKIYSRASFFLQQAVEKSAKSWAIGFGMLDRQKARKSRHRTPMIFLNMLKRYEGWLSIIEEISPDINTDISGTRKFISKGTHADTASTTYEVIKANLTIIYSLDKLPGLMAVIAKSLTEPLGIEPIPSFLWQRTILGASLLVLGGITFPHAFFTRYPDGNIGKGELVPSDYCSDLGIVKAMPEIVECLAIRMELLKEQLEQK